MPQLSDQSNSSHVQKTWYGNWQQSSLSNLQKTWYGNWQKYVKHGRKSLISNFQSKWDQFDNIKLIDETEVNSLHINTIRFQTPTKNEWDYNEQFKCPYTNQLQFLAFQTRFTKVKANIEKTHKETAYLKFKWGKSKTWNEWEPELPLLPWRFFSL